LAISPDALHKSLARGERGGTFFLQGEEEYLKEEAVAAITDAHLDPATRDFNLDQLRGPSLEPETLASIVQTPPLMSDWRVVIVREAQALAATAKTRALLDTLTERKIPGLVLVFCAQLPGRGSKPKTWTALERKAKTIVFNAMSSGDLPGWLIAKSAESGVDLEPGAARALAAAAGPELGRLVQEIAKLRDFTGDRRRIDVEDVRQLVGHIPTQNRWDWFDTVGDTRFAEARAALDTLLESESGVGIVIGLGTHMLRLGLARAGGEGALGEFLPFNQKFLASRLARQASHWTPAAIDAALDDLLRADRLLKSTSLNDRQVLEELLLRCQVRQAAA
jgi:DNA polymerase III subunit delta